MKFLLLTGIEWTDCHPALMLAGAAVCVLIGAVALKVLP